MTRTLLMLAALLAAPLLAPTAAAVPCTWYTVYVVYVEGVDVDACLSNESGRPTIVMVKHKSVGGVAVSDTESQFWGANWRFTDVLVWTYWRTPVVGQSATYAGFWCIDDGMDGNCDWFAAGTSTQALGTGAAVYFRDTSSDKWSLCVGSVVNCFPIPFAPANDFDYPPYLP